MNYIALYNSPQPLRVTETSKWKECTRLRQRVTQSAPTLSLCAAKKSHLIRRRAHLKFSFPFRERATLCFQNHIKSHTLTQNGFFDSNNARGCVCESSLLRVSKIKLWTRRRAKVIISLRRRRLPKQIIFGFNAHLKPVAVWLAKKLISVLVFQASRGSPGRPRTSRPSSRPPLSSSKFFRPDRYEKN